ncbi:MAG: hypothetical protein NT009_07905 [Proteobacteria bacterium]|nr:hypothetical protein [Pseudomonadota bacterium]
MEYLQKHELEQRFLDIFSNFLMLNENNKIGPLHMNSEGIYWGNLIIHALEEFRLRYGDYPAGFPDGLINIFENVSIPTPNHPFANKAASVCRKFNYDGKGFLFKYGMHQYLKDIFMFGKIRINSASYYKDESLNPSLRDDELRISTQEKLNGARITYYDKKIEKLRKIPVINDTITRIWESKSDYYVYCLSKAFVPRLFVDFNADACLIIKKPSEFLEKVMCDIAPEKWTRC